MFKSWWSRFRKAVLTFRKTKLGIAMIELAFTLPPVLAMILFCIELVRIKLAQVALDTMCHACYFNFIKRGHMKDFPAIVVIDSQGNDLYEAAIEEYCRE